MTNGDQDEEGEPHSSDFDILLSVVAALCPERIRVSLPPPGYQGRLVHLGEAKDLDITTISRAVAGLSHRDAQAHVDAEAALKLLGVLERLHYSHDAEAKTLRQTITAFVDARWEAMRPSLAGRVIENEYRGTIFQCFPALKREPELIERLAEWISDTRCHSYFIEGLLRDVGPTSIPEARGLIVVLNQRSREDRSAPHLMDSLFAAIGRGLGWNAWASLQAILRVCPAYAMPVDPSLDGKSLGRRVTLVQAKRLYRHHRSKKEESWHTSFALDPEQMRDLLAQTHSSVYVFHGPPMGGRGIPVIPTQLVSDLANHQGSGTQIATAMVANASRTLADWLTYDALALRTGDLYQDLVEKADGRAGSLPRRLLALPTLEVDVALVTRDLEG